MRLVAVSNLQSLSIYIIGAIVLWLLAPLVSVCYVLYCVILEIRLLRRSCVNCYYYGKTCCFGKGRLCSSLFKKGEPGRFTERQITWYDILPDFMVTIIPIVGGIILLIDEFSWIVILSILALLGLGFAGSAVVRGSFACKYCMQKDLGCPAQRLFEKKAS
ncbi:MAG: hypothetical protein JSU93_00010 [Methanobacteriota archaeon]|nr:MAG: hypothetical protein JSU93_00010 [Euryarchaeota archaeon]